MRGVAHIANTVVPTHDGHAFKVPVGTQIISNHTEVVVLHVGVCSVHHSEVDPWTDRSRNTIAQRADLPGW